MRRLLFFLTICLLIPINGFALGGKEHAADMQRIMPFAESAKNKKVTDFYRRVNEFLDFPYVQPGQKHDKSQPKRPKFVVEHPKFSQIRWQGKHRIWFHWGFNTDPRKFSPIVNSLNQAVQDGVITQQDVEEFWSMMNIEISRRNRTLMNEGAKVFGFGELGTISAQQRKQLNGLVTILYSIHVIGDHKTADKDIIAPLSRVYADVSNAIDNIAGKEAANFEKAKELKKQLRTAQSSPDAYLDVLERGFTPFILSLSGEGYNYKLRFKKLGYVLKR